MEETKTRKGRKNADQIMGQRLLAARIAMGMSQMEISNLLGITQHGFSILERGAQREQGDTLKPFVRLMVESLSLIDPAKDGPKARDALVAAARHRDTPQRALLTFLALIG